MPDFSWLAQGVNPVQLPDPLRAYAQTMSLADLAQTNQMNKFRIDEYQRKQKEMDAIQRVLPRVAARNFTPEAINEAVQSEPLAGPALYDYLDKKRTSDAAHAKTIAETDEKRVTATKNALADISQVAFGEAQNPDRLSLSRLRFTADSYKKVLPDLTLPQFAGDENNPSDVQHYLLALGNLAHTANQQISERLTARGQDITVRGQDSTAETTRRGQDIGAATTRRGQDISAGTARRGQDLEMQRFDQGSNTRNLKEVVDPTTGAITILDMSTRIARPATDAEGKPLPGRVDQATQERNRQQLEMADRVLGDIADVKPMLNGLSTGSVGAALGWMPGTSAHAVRAKIVPIKASLGLAQLQELRRSSPTGGALGNVSNKENDLLESAVGNLNADLPADQLLYQINKVETHLRNVQALINGTYSGAAAAAPAAATSARTSPTLPDPSKLQDGTVVTDRISGKKYTVRGGTYQ